MWIKREIELPKRSGAYAVYGKEMIGGSECQFTAYFDSDSGTFVDKDGEDLTGIDQSVQYWFDFGYVTKPTHHLPIRNIMARFFYWLDRVLHPACPKCGNGRIRHRRSEWTGKTWIEVYDCDRCGSEFV